MENTFRYGYWLILLFVMERFYLQLAGVLKIEAIPNHRSAHLHNTLVGGGIIIPIAGLLYHYTSGGLYPFLMSGVLLVALVSFVDDIKEVSVRLRLFVQVVATAILFLQFDVYAYPVALVLAIAAVFTLSLNAYNFLDGINGMLSANSLVHLSCLYYINRFKVHFIDEKLLVMTALAVLVFSWFNFRRKAVCFAGDVGSISLAFIICGCTLKLMIQTGNLIYINLLLIYYLDAVSTFVFRWLQGHDVFKAHNKHFYSFLTNVLHWPHLSVAVVYALLQLLIGVLVISAFDGTGNEANLYHITPGILLMLLAGIAVVLMRIRLEGSRVYRKRPVSERSTENLNPSR